MRPGVARWITAILFACLFITGALFYAQGSKERAPQAQINQVQAVPGGHSASPAQVITEREHPSRPAASVPSPSSSSPSSAPSPSQEAAQEQPLEKWIGSLEGNAFRRTAPVARTAREQSCPFSKRQGLS